MPRPSCDGNRDRTGASMAGAGCATTQVAASLDCSCLPLAITPIVVLYHAVILSLSFDDSKSASTSLQLQPTH